MLSLPEDDVGWERSETERSETKPGKGAFCFFFGVRPAGPSLTCQYYFFEAMNLISTNLNLVRPESSCLPWSKDPPIRNANSWAKVRYVDLLCPLTGASSRSKTTLVHIAGPAIVHLPDMVSCEIRPHPLDRINQCLLTWLGSQSTDMSAINSRRSTLLVEYSGPVRYRQDPADGQLSPRSTVSW